jgi:hypothetical protein
MKTKIEREVKAILRGKHPGKGLREAYALIHLHEPLKTAKEILADLDSIKRQVVKDTKK